MNDSTIVIAGMEEAEVLRFSLILGISAVVMAFVLAVLLIISLTKIRKLNKKYGAFMKGANGKDLESAVLTRFSEMDKMKTDIEYIFGKLNIACDMLLGAYQKMSIVKYDAFKEMGGKLSYCVALLDETNTGFIINSVHNVDGCYSYSKRIKNGISEIELSGEEQKTLEHAMVNGR